MTALHFAADLGALDIVQLLLKSGANIDAQDTEGQTPLMLAAICGHAVSCVTLVCHIVCHIYYVTCTQLNGVETCKRKSKP